MNYRVLVFSFIALLMMVASFLVLSVPPDEKAKPFDDVSTGSAVRNTEAQYRHGDVDIRIQHEKGAEMQEVNGPPRYCHASLETSTDKDRVDRRDYPDILPMGFSYGLFIPEKPIVGQYFIVVKEGDYNGEVLLIDPKGKISPVKGGLYFITPDHQLMFTTYADDCYCGSTVYDLKTGKQLAAIDSPTVEQWYRKDDAYFFMGTTWQTDREEAVAYYFNNRNAKFERIDDVQSWRRGAEPVKYDFEPTLYADCQSEQQP